MRAVQATKFGTPREVLTMARVVLPNLSESIATLPTNDSARQRLALVKVQAVSFTPSDYRILSGDAPSFKKPKNGFPYTPCGDFSGLIVEADAAGMFSVHDRVVCSWDAVGEGGLAEYAVVDTNHIVKCPANVTFVQAAALANSAVHALSALNTLKLPAHNARVLVLGASGGVGSTIVQLLKNRNVAFVAGTSTDCKLVECLGADLSIDYTQSAWWEHKALTDKPLDAIIDCAEGYEGWCHALDANILKTYWHGGVWLAFVGNEWDIKLESVWQMVKWFAPIVGRTLYSKLGRWWRPRYTMALGGWQKSGMEQVMQLAADGKIKAPVDSRGPHPFTLAGVTEAFDIHIARRGKGKVVVCLTDQVQAEQEEEELKVAI